MTYLRFLHTVLLFAFLLPFDAIAQTKIGFIAGTQQSRFNGDKFYPIPDSTRPTFSSIQGFRFAAFYNIKLNRFFSIRPEIAYSQKGGHQKLDSGYDQISTPPGWKDIYNTSKTLRFNYIEMPIVARFSALLFKYGKGEVKKQVTFEIFAGGHVSYLISNSFEGTITKTRASGSDTTKMYNFTTTEATKGSIRNDKINRWDAGLVAGFGVKTKLTKLIDIYAEVRYTNSYATANHGHWDRIMPDPKSWFNTIVVNPAIINSGLATFSAGVLINFGKEGFHFKPAE